MKVFVSWSGELKGKMVGILKTGIPCVLHSVYGKRFTSLLGV